MIQKNWQELIKPTKLEIIPGHDAACHARIVAEPLERGRWERHLKGVPALQRHLSSCFEVVPAELVHVQHGGSMLVFVLGIGLLHMVRVGRKRSQSSRPFVPAA